MFIGIAVCFDYSLFMLSRFREEMLENNKTRQSAVLACLEASGHVVCLSGATLFCTFIILLLLPQNFLMSVGYGCSTTLLTGTCLIFNMHVCWLWLHNTNHSNLLHILLYMHTHTLHNVCWI